VVDVGYEINKDRKFCIRHSHHVVIGAYNVTFNKRAVFVYRCKQDCSGYFIRRENWKDCLEIDPYIEETIKSNVKFQYQEHIMKKVLSVKEQFMLKTAKRRDFQ
jgi:hypothetical protein